MVNPILLVSAAIWLSYLFAKLRYLRFKQYSDLPQPPNNLIWGHLKILGEFAKRGIHDRHPDLRPLTPPLLLVTSHEITEQVVRPSKLFPLSPQKSPTWTFLTPAIGKTSLLGQEGHEWKVLRKLYNPVFTLQHLWSLLPLILDKTKPFVRYLDDFASNNEVFPLETLVSNLTFNIIGAAVLDVDLETQHMDRSKQVAQSARPLPAQRHRLANRIDTLVRALVTLKYAEARSPQTATERQEHRHPKVLKIKSLVGLSFRDLEPETLTPSQLTQTSDQVRTFLFAGHDTLTSSLQWAIYELSRTPHALAAVLSELDSLLGPETEPSAIRRRLLSHRRDIFTKMRYINAVMKKTLRVHPPAGGVRMTPPGSGFTLRTPADGKEYLVDGLILYPCQSIFHRDPAVYGDDADKWVPERWLDERAGKIPATAWRPFERGPSNCLGLELANLESRIIIALVARKYEFVKVALGGSLVSKDGRPELDEYGQFKVKPGEEWYDTRRITAKPVDGTMMRVKFSG